MVDTIVSTLATMFSGSYTAAAGGNVLLQDGTYANTARVTLRATAVPVRVAAQNRGGAIITGFPIDIGSSGLIFEGFDLRFSGQYNTDFVRLDNVSGAFRRNKLMFDNQTSGDLKWLIARKDNIMIDHNEFSGKTTVDDIVLIGGSTFVRGCKVLNNHFHDFTETSSTKSESIRVGESSMAFMDFDCEIAYNRFDTIDADTEVMSIKCQNVNIHHNTLEQTNGSIVLRQAYNCKVNNNTLINGGIRVYGTGHEITKNQVIRNTMGGGVSRPLFLASANVADLQTASGTPGASGITIPLNADESQVRACTISNNLFVNDDQSTGNLCILGDNAAEAFQPSGNTITFNVITASLGTLTNAISGAVGWNVNTISGNILYPTSTAIVGDMPAAGYTNVDPALKRLDDQTCRCSYVLTASDVGVDAA